MVARPEETARIRVVVRTGRKNESLARCADGSYSVEVHARPIDGKANDAVVALIAREGGVAKSSVEVVVGLHARMKTVALPRIASERLGSAYPVEVIDGDRT